MLFRETLKITKVKHESSTISMKLSHRRALKIYKWRTRAKLPSSKDISEAQSILTNHDSWVSLSKGVYNNDDCGKRKSKDSNHTRRSKQNTYHVVNKNIAWSKVTDGRRRKRGCLPGHPKLRLLVVLEYLPWGALGIPKLRLLPILVP